MTGKSILITGATSGLGLASAKALLNTGATLYLTARNEDKVKALRDEFDQDTKVNFITMNLLSLKSVRAGAMKIREFTGHIDVFICNAGVMACPFALSEEGVESQFAVNFLSQYYLFEVMRANSLIAAGQHNSRVVIVSSAGHKIAPVDAHDINFELCEYDAWQAYGRSKSAAILLAHYIDRKFRSVGVRAYALHPGSIFTPLQRHQPNMSPDAAMYQTPEMQALLKSPQQGAATTVWAVVEPEFESLGDLYLEDAQVGAFASQEGPRTPGYASWAFDDKMTDEIIVAADKIITDFESNLQGAQI